MVPWRTGNVTEGVGNGKSAERCLSSLAGSTCLERESSDHRCIVLSSSR